MVFAPLVIGLLTVIVIGARAERVNKFLMVPADQLMNGKKEVDRLGGSGAGFSP